MNLLRVLLASSLLGACALPAPSGFGKECGAETACAEGLACDLDKRMCLPPQPPTPPEPPDTRGRSCDEPMPLAFPRDGDLAFARETFTLVNANTSDTSFPCHEGRRFVVAFEVPAAEPMAERPEIVLRAEVTGTALESIALLDAACGELVPPTCVDVSQHPSGGFVLPAVAPGLHHLVVTVSPPPDDGTPIVVTLEQVRCPVGFLPFGDDACRGFVSVIGLPPRTGHTATTLADGRILVAGGEDANGERLADAWTFDPALATFSPHGLVVARSRHSAALLDDGSVLLLGGDREGGTLTSGESFIPAFGGSVQDTTLKFAYVGPAGSLAGALSGTEAALITGPNDVAQILSRPTDVVGAGCDSPSQCPDGFTCVAILDPPPNADQGVCICDQEPCTPDGSFGFWNNVDDFGATPVDRFSRGAVLPVPGPTGPTNVVFVGGRTNTASAAAPPEFVPGPGALFVGSFRTFRPLPASVSLPPVLDPRAVIVDSRVVMAGGRDVNENPLATLALFSPFVDLPAVLRSLSTPRADHALARVFGREVIAIGGRGVEEALLMSTDVFDVSTQLVAPGPLLPLPRADAVAASTIDGDVLVVGGRTPGGLADDALLLTVIGATLEAPTLGFPVQLAPAADLCTDATPLEGPTGSVYASTFAANNDYEVNELGNCTGDVSFGRDVAFALTLPARATASLLLTSDTFADLVLYVLDQCPPMVGSCVVGTDAIGFGVPESLTVTAGDMETEFFVIVDGYAANTRFPFTLTWEIVEAP